MSFGEHSGLSHGRIYGVGKHKWLKRISDWKERFCGFEKFTSRICIKSSDGKDVAVEKVVEANTVENGDSDAADVKGKRKAEVAEKDAKKQEKAEENGDGAEALLDADDDDVDADLELLAAAAASVAPSSVIGVGVGVGMSGAHEDGCVAAACAVVDSGGMVLADDGVNVIDVGLVDVGDGGVTFRVAAVDDDNDVGVVGDDGPAAVAAHVDVVEDEGLMVGLLWTESANSDGDLLKDLRDNTVVGTGASIPGVGGLEEDEENEPSVASVAVMATTPMSDMPDLQLDLPLSEPVDNFGSTGTDGKGDAEVDGENGDRLDSDNIVPPLSPERRRPRHSEPELQTATWACRIPSSRGVPRKNTGTWEK